MRPGDMLDTMYTYGSISGDGLAISVADNRGVYICSIVIGNDRINNISRLYKALHRKLFATCLTVELHNASR